MIDSRLASGYCANMKLIGGALTVVSCAWSKSTGRLAQRRGLNLHRLMNARDNLNSQALKHRRLAQCQGGIMTSRLFIP